MNKAECCMDPLVAEWVEKAEGDFAIVQREMHARKRPSYDGACFHAQQCAEKYLKARLTQVNIAFPLTHDLVELLKRLLPAHPDWLIFKKDLSLLTDFAVRYRYPGISATRQTARETARRCRAFRTAARKALGLK